MDIITIPLNSDNFGYLVVSKESKNALIVDVSNNPDDVFAIVNRHDVNVKYVLSTHKHWDHAGGNDRFKQLIPDLDVCGHEVDQCEGCTKFVSDGEEFMLDDITIRCLLTPGHTQGHICYYLTHGEQRVVFTGDILFNGGAGRFFEGSAQDVYGSFQKLMALPPDTAVYCGHEYTLANYRFALSVDAENADLIEANEKAVKLIDRGLHTVPSSIRCEMLTNPFVRAMDMDTRIIAGLGEAAVGVSDPIALLAAVREAKNNFK